MQRKLVDFNILVGVLNEGDEVPLPLWGEYSYSMFDTLLSYQHLNIVVGDKFFICKLEVHQRWHKRGSSKSKPVMWHDDILGIDEYVLFFVGEVFRQKRIGIVYVVCCDNIIPIPLEALQRVLHIIWWIVDVIVTNEAIVILTFLVQEQMSPIFLEVYVSKHDM